MSMTDFGTSHALTIKRWEDYLAIEAAKKSYFSRFIGKSKNSLIMLREELFKGAGDKVTYGLRMKLGSEGVEGDTTFAADDTAGHTGQEALVFHADSVLIDQLRKSTKSKGKMSEQRVSYNIRAEGNEALSTWWAEEIDENFFIYLSGGLDANSVVDAGAHHTKAWNGRATNAFRAATNVMYGGDATSPLDLADADIMNLEVIEKAVAYSETTDPMIQPFRIDGQDKFVMLMHTYQAFDLRTAASENDWLDIHKNTDRGSNAMMYKNAMGEYAGVILHKHRNCVRMDKTAVTGDNYAVLAARALFLGAQSGCVAYGQAIGNDPGTTGTATNKGRYRWVEESDDYGNALAITAGCIFGVQKTQFNSKDFGVISVDTGCLSPF